MTSASDRDGNQVFQLRRDPVALMAPAVHVSNDPGEVSFENYVYGTAPGMETLFREMLGEVLEESKLSLTIDELQEKLRSADTFDDVLGEAVLQGAKGRRFVREWRCRLEDLWNYTVREDLGGRRPVEWMADFLKGRVSLDEVPRWPVIVPADFYS